jgi:predicted ester cyclase
LREESAEMAAVDNKRLIVQTWDELINRRNLALLDTIYSPGYLARAAAGEVPTLAQMRAILDELFTGFPDLRVEVTHALAEGEFVATHESWYGTHRGPFRGHTPTGKPIARASMHIFRLSAGKVDDEWAVGESFESLVTTGYISQP